MNGISMLAPSARLTGHVAAENAVFATRRWLTYELVPTGSCTTLSTAGLGLTEAQARERHDCEVGVACYLDLVRPVIGRSPKGVLQLIMERHRRSLQAQLPGGAAGRRFRASGLSLGRAWAARAQD